MKLGEILVDEGLLTETQLADALQQQREKRVPLGRVLLDNDLVSERDMVKALATQLNLTFVDLAETNVDVTAATMVPESLCKRHTVLPIGLDQNKLVVAMSDPSHVVALDDVRTVTGMDVRPVVATKSDILSAIDKHHSASEEIEELASEFEDDEEASLAELRAVTEEAPVVKFVNLLITQAVKDGASDIHIEPTEKNLRVRYRIDGVLHQVMTHPRSIAAGVTSRLKIMADLDIAERRVPQDGRISVSAAGKAIDLRVSTLPTVYGEKIVMRILDKSSIMLELEDLGFLDRNFKMYEQSFTKPYGMILVTGPTGSGKSTTLYATLNILNRPEVNIITTEDPVEYRLHGISQVQVNKKAGLTFAAALRSILRQDPDIVLVGETRDKETAQIAIEASLTGHLVLSTLHTNDAPSAITRLTEMGIEPFLVASAVDCVLAQRLARRLCSSCKQAYTPRKEVLEQAGFPQQVIDNPPEIFRPNGCKRCGNTGYKGRLAIHEVMRITEEIERMAVDRASSEDIMRLAVKQGMYTLRMDGLQKVLMGDTTIEEIGRIII